MKFKLDIKSCIVGALLCAAIVFTVGAAQNKPRNEEGNRSSDSTEATRRAAAHVYRVPCSLTSGSHDLQIFIATGSKENPLVTIADNDGYPAIKDLYAKPARMDGGVGIIVTIRFEAPAKGREIALNVLQEGMTPEFEVMPFKRDR